MSKKSCVTAHGNTGRPAVIAFQTPIGWVALRWQEDAFDRISIGHRTRRASLGSLGAIEKNVVQSHAQLFALRQQIMRYLRGEDIDFREIPVVLRGTAFQRRVLRACRAISYGQTTTYGQLARNVGSPRAARAVGQVMAHNPLPLVIPCHRVLGTGDRMTGFSAPRGVRLKQELLALESSTSQIDSRTAHLASSCMSSA